MRIGIRAGHTISSPGASGILNETTEARKIKSEVINILKNYADVIDLQPPENMSYPDELSYGINLANSSNLDLAFSIHLNNAYNYYNGALGTETLIYPGSSAKSIATKIVNNLANLGFVNRGVIERSDLGELRSSKSPWIIVEVCFVEATEDVRVYNNAGYQKLAEAIASGIVSTENKNGYVVTNYLPYAYNGYTGVNVEEITHKYFNGINTYVRFNSKGIWIETQYLSMDKCEELKNSLGNLFYSIEY